MTFTSIITLGNFWKISELIGCSRGVKVTDKEINCLKKMHIFQIITFVIIILKQLFASGSVNKNFDFV